MLNRVITILVASSFTWQAILADTRLAKICAPLLPGQVDASTCSITRLKVGNTNALSRLDAGDDCYLIREFGTQAALCFDRATENSIFARLAASGLAPPLIATFAGGRIEGWIEGAPCTAAECRRPAVYEPVARALVALHRFDLDASAAVDDAETWACTTAEAWLTGARRCADALEAPRSFSPKLAERVRGIDLDGVASQLELIRSRLSSAPRTYCHNDLSNTNVHRNVATGDVHLIDFEFSGHNYRGFDLATHLSHWAGGATDGLYDDDAFPSADEQRRFFAEYAREDGTVTVDALAEEVKAALPLAHCVWGLWALCALPEAIAQAQGGPRPFSHIEYAERRLGACARALESYAEL